MLKYQQQKKPTIWKLTFFFFKQPVGPRKNCKLQPILTE